LHWHRRRPPQTQERDIVQNIYIRRVDKVGGKLTNVDIATIPMVKDPWKLDNPAK
jgi:branched-chain amino acid transport system substrate-binding protein